MEDEAPCLTEDQRRSARAMAGLGVSRRQIAKYLGIDDTQLQMLLGDELDQAEADVNSKVAKALFTMATQKNNVAAAIFWMKARAGWRERQEISATVATAVVAQPLVGPYEQLTREEWLAKHAAKRRA